MLGHSMRWGSLRPAVAVLGTAWLAAVLTLGDGRPAAAQFRQVEPGGIKLGESRIQRWQCGVVVKAVGGACRGIVGYMACPVEWPEQTVKIVAEDISPQAKVSYDDHDGTVKLMIVRIPTLAAGEEVKALVTFEIERHTILPPDDVDQFVLPDPKKLDRKLMVYLGESPKIETRHPKIRDVAREIGVDQPTAWKRVEAIYDWVRDHVKYEFGPLKGALAALNDGTGDCEDLTSLFVAICRAQGIPARTVWIPGHAYGEFYLLNQEGKGHWFPCQPAGARAFGEMPEFRPVLQKGDNYRPPWNSRDRQRYLSEYLTGMPTPGGGKPQVRFVRELIAE